ncbi:MAG: hypothetical protein PHT07_00395 [Paludibacter sp.]|nr:hypothetical protein [Paludibacter sp.]
MKKLKLAFISVLFFLFPIIAFSQGVKQNNVWEPFRFFIGKWTGTNTGQSGNGTYERTYQFVLNNRFIEVRNKSTYPPTVKNPKGEVHEDIGYISYDKGRKKFVLRQFHVEGFVNQYVLDSISQDKKAIMFTSEAIENIASGWRAKESYQLLNDSTFIESFELAEPKGAFEVYSKATLKRSKN